ncbi:uncharacterized protein KGF55_004386 [Candida pseudojiufengensis]|uniref:uncharacterized protein n=1 Tax=Candida pseudojiufengensis TaxID=497109 RepID=UPI0022258B80|nr:uncharacterized protein KGF55_004386 [Candida pseudojiufengensis]KAI5960816.1 hypothetical protein KGF55_004386 [Candida pseudojiufengensis]
MDRRASYEESRLQRRRTIQSELADAEAESVGDALPEGFKGEGYEEIPPKLEIISKYEQYSPIILNIIHGSIWGVLVRKGLMQLTTYNGAYLSGVIWANFTACLIMGLAIDSGVFWMKLLDNDIFPNKGAIPVYTGITTGFCGTVSSFSTVILDAFNRTADTQIGKYYHYPNAAYGIMQFFAVMLAEFGLSIMGFHMGKHISTLIDNYLPSINHKTYKIIEKISMIIGVCLIIITCVLLGTKPNGSWRNWTFSMFFAPFGAILRFYLSKYVNSKVKNFPMGTFTANVSGTLLLAIFTLIGRGKLPNGKGRINSHIMGCHILTGLDDGFCGALTTVSTFVAELFGLKTIHSYFYGATSALISFAIMILILGSYNWTVGLTDPVC